jgi:hypothetical protein
MTQVLEYASPAEADAATFLIRLALANGFNVSVHDGEEDWTVRRSTDLHTILSAMCQMEEDYLTFHKVNGSKGGGWMQLVWGNSAPELVSDYSANADMDALWNEWHAMVDA